MTDQTGMQRNERIKALEDRGFQYAAIYLDDPILFENLTINDLSVLRYASLSGKDAEKELAVRGRHFGMDELR